MTQQEFDTLETFLQYGDLKTAELVFVGLEEGLGGNHNIQHALDARTQLMSHEIFNEYRGYINKVDTSEGWFIKDSRCLEQAFDIIDNKNVRSLQDVIVDNKSPIMKLQARLHWLLQDENRSSNYSEISNENFRHYESLHRKDSKSAMIDFFPFPRQRTKNEKIDLYKECEGIEKFKSMNAYYKHYENHYEADDKRYNILKGLYDNLPMKISVAYSGTNGVKFKLEKFYRDLGFSNFKEHCTDKVNKGYNKDIKGTHFLLRQPFYIGERINKKSERQIVVLTTFFGQYTSKNDIDVISTWLP